MYRTARQPAWQRDLAWASGLLLAVAVAAFAALFSLARLSLPGPGTALIESFLRLTLLPADTDASGGAAPLAVRTFPEYRPGEPLRLLPGLDAYADATEVPGFAAEDAVQRGAGVLAERFVEGGREAVLAGVDHAELRAQLATVLGGPLPTLLAGAIGRELLPAGLEDGSRLADWRTQAATHPGEPVQPIVGVFVTFPVRDLEGATNREIGGAVVAALADVVMAGGLGEALELVTNDNLRTRLRSAVDARARAQAHELFGALLLGYAPEMEGRLQDAKAVLAGAGDAGGLSGLLPASSLAGLTREQADALALRALAERSFDQGAAAAAAQLQREEQAARVTAVAPLLDAFGAGAHARYLTLTYAAGAAALVFLITLVAFSRGALRLLDPGLAIGLGAVPGAWLVGRAGAWVDTGAALPAGPVVEGVPAALAGLVAFAVGRLPADALATPERVHLVLVLTGAGLVVLAAAYALVRGVRPRRRRFR